MSDLANAKTWTAARWVPLAQSTGVLADQFATAKSDQARAIALGKFLGGKVGRAVPVAAGGRTGTAVLRATPGRSRQTGYYYAVTWDPPADAGPEPPSDHPPTDMPMGKAATAKGKTTTAKAAKSKGKTTAAKAARSNAVEPQHNPPPAAPTAGGNDELW